jgi:DNA-binding NarL/FixJ family response regulator
MDIRLPGRSGFEATREIVQKHPQTKVIMLTSYAEDEMLFDAIAAGAAGYVLKQSASAELLNAIRAVVAGRRYLDTGLTDRVTEAFMARHRRGHGDLHSLTEREAEVLRLIAVGHSNKEIAALLELSVKTIEVHRASGMRKLNLRGRVEIVRFAVQQGWLDDT